MKRFLPPVLMGFAGLMFTACAAQELSKVDIAQLDPDSVDSTKLDVGTEDDTRNIRKALGNEGLLKLRLQTLPKINNQIPVEKSNNPRKLTYSNDILPSRVSDQIKASTIISLLYYDGKKVRYDWKRSDIGEATRLYGFVMSRSLLSYLLGKSFCEGRIKSLNDPIGTYVKELKGTFYGNVKITDALNMTAGDQVFAGTFGSAAVIAGKKTVFELINEFSNRSPSKVKSFNNSVRSAMAFGWAVASASPEGFGKFASKALSQEAGFKYPSFLLADKSNIPIDVGFYATRTDWLRAAIRIGELYNSRGCMGDYLRSATRNSVRIRKYSNRGFGKQFWLKNSKLRFNSLEMKSDTGGQRAVIDVDKRRVLIIQAINLDYETKIIYDAIFN